MWLRDEWLSTIVKKSHGDIYHMITSRCVIPRCVKTGITVLFVTEFPLPGGCEQLRNRSREKPGLNAPPGVKEGTSCTWTPSHSVSCLLLTSPHSLSPAKTFTLLWGLQNHYFVPLLSSPTVHVQLLVAATEYPGLEGTLKDQSPAPSSMQDAGGNRPETKTNLAELPCSMGCALRW